MNFHSHLFVFLLGIGLLVQTADAGAGAFVNACVYYRTKPLEPFVVSFSVPSSSVHCMNAVGKSTSTQVSDAGLTCALIGYVEEKGSSTGGDLCATQESVWGVSYIAGTMSGSTLSSWSYNLWGNYIELFSTCKGTVVCPSKALCTARDCTWDTGAQGPLWIIFDPESSVGDPEPIPTPTSSITRDEL